MRWAGWIVAACAVLTAGMGSAQTPSSPPAPKLALVIGNADYNLDGRIDTSNGGDAAAVNAGFLPDLRNPINDATDTRDALARIGFQVDFVANANAIAMRSAIASFGQKIATAPNNAQVVIYYSGHGLEVNGANFIVPSGAKLPELDFSRMPSRQVETILDGVLMRASVILEFLEDPTGDGVNVVFLDGSRNNPWDRSLTGVTRAAGSRGLAEIRSSTRATAIVYSTAPGTAALDGEGRNSPFAAALKEVIVVPGVPVGEMLNRLSRKVESATAGMQRPWVTTSILPNVCLAGGCVTPVPAPAASSPTSDLQTARLRIAELELQLAQRGQAPSPATQAATRPTLAVNAEPEPARFAIVFGNSGYKLDAANRAFGPLINPANDAKLVAATLSSPELGFNVRLKTDRTVEQMDADIRELAAVVQGARDATKVPPIVFIWFSGHGQQSDSRNYLIPVGGAFERNADLNRNAIEVGWMLATLQESGAGVKLLFLDACRNNNLPRSARDSRVGLTEMRAPPNTLIVYSTAPDDTATDGTGDTSPFAKAFATYARQEGSVGDMIINLRRLVNTETEEDQTPWDGGSLMQPFSFRRGT